MTGIYKSCLLVMMIFGLNFLGFSQCPTLVWSDEFSGTELDLTKWEPQTGDGCDLNICGWGNNELQYYKSENAVVSNGTLKIIAKKERVKSKAYTSARLRSKGLGDFTFGRFEANIKVLAGQGYWPAFWMLSTNEPYGGWPQSGEIDIMEMVGQEPAKIFGTIHYGNSYETRQSQGKDFLLYDGSSFDQNFHVYAVEWEPGEIRWYVDDVLYATKTTSEVSPWPFDASNQMHMLLNLAVGGDLPGSPDNSTPFPSQMEVDYVRVYDTFEPSISGDRLVSNQEAGVSYQINNSSGNTSYSWSVPSGATIVSGANSNQVTVDWGSVGGDVVCNVTTGCNTKAYKIGVTVEPPFVYDFSFENFDQAENVTLGTITGQLTEVSNPDASGVNSSATSGEYVRDNQEQYDVIIYSTSSIPDAAVYSGRQEKLVMDILTNAPVGTEVYVQLENSVKATGDFPAGRHSRYVASIGQNGSWDRVQFDYLDSPDGGTTDSEVDQIVILFAPNTFTGDTYFWDNFDSYKIDDGTTANNPPVASFTFQANDLSVDFDASSSSDSDGNIVSYSWDFGDGNSASGELVSHTYASSGDYFVTLTVEDNGAATDAESQTVSVSGGGNTGNPVSVHVQSIVTGTQSAGQGNKRGTATVVVHDNNESPVQGVTVSGTFSGTFSESVSGVTDASGSVTLVTSATAKGGVTVGFCVDDLVDSSLVYDNSLNNITCVGSGGARFDDSQDELENPFEFIVYPNPFTDQLSLRAALKTKSEIRLQIFDVSGQKVFQTVKKLSSENQEISFNLTNLESGIYFLDIILDSEKIQQKIVKN